MAVSRAETFESRFASALSRFVPGTVSDTSELVRLGLDSLTLVRIIVTVVGDDTDREIDPGEIGDLRTIGDLRAWLRGSAGTVDDELVVS
jgi:acyl carrier protein